ncbi:MAG: glycosyltransferase family 87 protein [Bryobacterales bacterium]
MDAKRSNARPPVDVEPRPQMGLRASWGLIAGAVALAFLGGLALMQADWLASGPANDFLSFYSAAGASDIYSQSSIDAARPPAFATVAASARPYARIPLHAKLYSFLRPLPYPTAYLVFQVLMLWCMGAFVFGWLPNKRALTLTASAVSVPLFFSFMRGQDWPLALAAFAGCVVAERYRAPILAGFCLSVAAIHPAAVIAAPLLLIAHRRWAMCTGFLSGLTVMATVSFWTAGLDWPQRFAAAFFSALPRPIRQSCRIFSAPPHGCISAPGPLPSPA